MDSIQSSHQTDELNTAKGISVVNQNLNLSLGDTLQFRTPSGLPRYPNNGPLGSIHLEGQQLSSLNLQRLDCKSTVNAPPISQFGQNRPFFGPPRSQSPSISLNSGNYPRLNNYSVRYPPHLINNSGVKSSNIYLPTVQRPSVNPHHDQQQPLHPQRPPNNSTHIPASFNQSGFSNVENNQFVPMVRFSTDSFGSNLDQAFVQNETMVKNKIETIKKDIINVNNTSSMISSSHKNEEELSPSHQEILSLHEDNTDENINADEGDDHKKNNIDAANDYDNDDDDDDDDDNDVITDNDTNTKNDSTEKRKSANSIPELELNYSSLESEINKTLNNVFLESLSKKSEEDKTNKEDVEIEENLRIEQSRLTNIEEIKLMKSENNDSSSEKSPDILNPSPRPKSLFSSPTSNIIGFDDGQIRSLCPMSHNSFKCLKSPESPKSLTTSKSTLSYLTFPISELDNTDKQKIFLDEDDINDGYNKISKITSARDSLDKPNPLSKCLSAQSHTTKSPSLMKKSPSGSSLKSDGLNENKSNQLIAQGDSSTVPTPTSSASDSPTKKSPTKTGNKPDPVGSPVKSPRKSIKSLSRTPDGPPPSTAEKKKIPMNKVQVGAAPLPNLKTVRSKIGSLENTNYKPGGGNVKIESRKLDFSKAQPKIAAKNDSYAPSGGDKKITQVKLQWNAKPKVGSLENATYKSGGGDKKIETIKLGFKDKAKPKVGSKDNTKYVPAGGAIKEDVENELIKVEKLYPNPPASTPTKYQSSETFSAIPRVLIDAVSLFPSNK